MRPDILLLFICFSLNALSQQMNVRYKEQIHYADSLFAKQQYTGAASAYSIAFRQNGNKGLVEDRYHAAVSYALSANRDSALYNLFRMAEKAGWDKYEQLAADSNFISLHNDSRWNKLVNKVRSNKAETDAVEKKENQ
jgi:hypothetical protein